MSEDTREPVVILVEDDTRVVDLLKEVLQPLELGRVMVASDLDTARRMFWGRPPSSIAAIYVGGLVPPYQWVSGQVVSSACLVVEVRDAGFQGRVIGSSADEDVLEGLRRAGSDHVAPKPWPDLAQFTSLFAGEEPDDS